MGVLYITGGVNCTGVPSGVTAQYTVMKECTKCTVQGVGVLYSSFCLSNLCTFVFVCLDVCLIGLTRQ